MGQFWYNTYNGFSEGRGTLMCFYKYLLCCVFIGSCLFSLPNSLLAARENLISLEADEVAIGVVLKSIAEQADANIVISKNIQGTVTVKLKDVSVAKALQAVLEVSSYTFSIKDDIIFVYSFEERQQQERFSKITTRVYTLKYAGVKEIQRALLSMKSPRGRIELNEKGNQVIVTDTQEKIEEMETAIARLDQEQHLRQYKLIYAKAAEVKAKLETMIPSDKGILITDERTNMITVKAVPAVSRYVDDLILHWDIPSRQVLIEAKMLQITLSQGMKTGIDWDYLKGKYNINLQFPQDLETGAIMQIGTMTRNSYKTVLEALESSSNTNVLSSPHIVVMDGQEASILVGSSEPYLVQNKDIDTGQVTTETKFLDVGIKLRVTPTITADNTVVMKIHPEVSSPRRVAEVDNALAVDTTEADTTLVVRNNETVLLGGLIKDSIVKSENRLPYLGRIPILGYLFKNSTEEKVKQELVVFITPRIIAQSPDAIPAMERAKMIEEITRRTKELHRALGQDYFRHYEQE
ncbi:MAG: hypothetical protein NC924_06605 [Candidatus Omnitrophica bacterium]|nr:hypothetical protein [Candidatus Omnitrophota bacterium]